MPSELDRYHANYTKPLVGGTITDVVCEDGLIVLVVECKDGVVRAGSVMCDPEGNGPGHLDIFEVEGGSDGEAT